MLIYNFEGAVVFALFHLCDKEVAKVSRNI